MIKPTLISSLILGMILITSPEKVYPQFLSADMQRLCAAADKIEFTPLIESIRTPNKDPLLNGIEFGSDFKETTRLLAGRHPDSILILDATPLFYSSISGNWQAANALLNAGASINYRMPTGATPLSMAVLSSQFPMACKLIENGATLPTAIAERNTLMSYTLSMNPRDSKWGALFLDHLLENGFDANEFDSERSTPLMSSVALHNIPAIKVLLKHGARLDIVKEGDRTVWSVALEKNNKQVLKLLKEAQKRAVTRQDKKTVAPAYR